MKRLEKTNAAHELLVRGVMVRRGYLLACRNRRRGNVYLPGGHIEWGESAAQALRREIREELGMRVQVGRFLGACEYTFVQNRRRVCEINLCFEMRIAQIAPPQPIRSAEPHIEFFWIPWREVKRSELLPDIVRTRLELWVKTARWAQRHWASNYHSPQR